MASLVIKVKYEELLRRFNVAINGDGRLALSMEGLWLKICSLFDLPSDSEFRLSYKDEDGDLITLVDDDDLHDVVRQGLNPVRITIHQRPESSSANPSGTSENLDGIKTVTSVDNWPPFINDMVKRMNIVKEPQLESFTPFGSSKAGVLPHENATISNSKIDGIETVKPPLGPSNPFDKSKRSSYKSPYSKWSKSKRSSYKFSSSKWFKSAPGNKKNNDIFALKKEFVAPLRLEKESTTSNAAKRTAGFPSFPAPVCDQSKQIHPPNRNSDKTDNMTSIVHTGITCDVCGLKPISGPRFKSKVKYDYDLCHGCFLRVENEMDYCRIDVPLTYLHHNRAPDVTRN